MMETATTEIYRNVDWVCENFRSIKYIHSLHTFENLQTNDYQTSALVVAHIHMYWPSVISSPVQIVLLSILAILFDEIQFPCNFRCKCENGI